MSWLITWHGMTGDALGRSMNIIQRRYLMRRLIRTVMQRIKATMRNPNAMAKDAIYL